MVRLVARWTLTLTDVPAPFHLEHGKQAPRFDSRLQPPPLTAARGLPALPTCRDPGAAGAVADVPGAGLELPARRGRAAAGMCRVRVEGGQAGSSVRGLETDAKKAP